MRKGFARAGHHTYTRKGSLYKWKRTGHAKYRRIKGSADPVKLKAYRRDKAMKLKTKAEETYSPLTPLEGKGFGEEVSKLQQLKYGGQERELQGERRISGAQQQNIGDWYGQYQRDLEGARVATQQGYQRAQSAVNTQANTGATQDEAQRVKLNQEAQQQAAIRGTATSVAPEAQQASQARRALSGGFAGMIASHGASQNAYSGSLRRAGSAARVGAHQDEAKRARQIDKLSRDLQGEKGEYGVSLRGQLREGERKYALERQAFGLDVQKARDQTASQRAARRQAAKDKRASRKLTKRQQNISQRGQTLSHEDRIRGQNLSEADRQWKRDHPTKGKGPQGRKPTRGPGSDDASTLQRKFSNLATRAGSNYKGSPLAKDKTGKHYRYYVEEVKRPDGTVAKKKRRYGFNELYKQVLDSGLPSDLAEAATLRAMGRYPSRKTARRLFRKYGVRMKSKKW